MKASTLIKSLATATGEALFIADVPNSRTYQATVVGTGAVTGTVIFEGSNDKILYVPIGTVTLTGTTSATDGFTSSAAWANIRARVTAISGTGALITATVGY